MLQNVQRGMVRDDDSVFRRQIVALLANPRSGPLSAAAIAANLGVSPDRIFAALESLICADQLVCVAPNTSTAPPVVGSEPLESYPRLAPAATPPDVPDALRGDWLQVGGTEHAEARGGRGGGEGFTAEDTEGERSQSHMDGRHDVAGGKEAEAVDGRRT